MNKLISHALMPALLAAGLVAGLATPLAAAPLQPPAVAAPSSNLTLVRDHQRYIRKWPRHRHSRPQYRHHYSHRPHWRPRYRHHWRPRSGFYLGLGLAPLYEYRVAPRRYYRSYSSAHVRWCHNRYRSYRAWDNSWQPYHGPRRQCRSPYY